MSVFNASWVTKQGTGNELNMGNTAASQADQTSQMPFVVGVGSSAGGIEALINLVSNLPEKLNASLVIAQHLSPSHKSQMSDILARETRYEVQEIEDNVAPKNNVIYVGPPGHHVIYRQGRLRLEKKPEDVTPKPSVNLLFESLADELGDHSVGVVLSGTGSDGSRGLRAVKSAGGYAIVQSPETAKYDGMPTASLQSVEVDRVLSPHEIGAEIANFCSNLIKSFFPNSDEEKNQLMTELYDVVRDTTKIDFSFYKQSTLLRRVNRRLIATNNDNLKDYLAQLHHDTDEVRLLSKELLISVTNFFRDKEAFEAIRSYICDIVENKKEGENIRLWVAGCATGEEAYSLAILFLEEMRRQNKELSIQVFGTDIDDNALAVARKGSYSTHSISSLDSELVEKYFRFEEDSFYPSKKLRDIITFSRQDITRDPPFLHLDMISFRNVMIYFNTELQQRVLSLFRYSLLNAGILFLGKSESIGLKEEYFVAVDRRSRIFKVSQNSKRPAVPRMLKGVITPSKAKDTPSNSYERLFNETIIREFGPSVLINTRFTILHSRGDLQPFVSFPSGTPDLNLSKLIVSEFSAELISTFNKAKRDSDVAISRPRQIEKDNRRHWKVVVIPLEQFETDLFIVNFRRIEEVPVAKNDTTYDTENADVAELIATREQLQTLTEEMAASAEEMQALNEEVQAANEELQANNEELEATNEELQATNEELISVNEESMRKSGELSAINGELESVYNTLDFPLFVFDDELLLSRTNEAANRKYHLSSLAYKKRAKELHLPEYFIDIENKLRATLKTSRKMNIIIKPTEKETLNLFITPLINARQKTTGAILVIIDNSELVRAHEDVEKNQDQLLSIMNNSLSVVALKDNSGRYEFVNARFEEIFGITSEEVLGKTDNHLFNKKMAKMLREKDLDTMRSLAPVRTVDEFERDDGAVVLESVRFPIFDTDGTVKSICTQANDITRTRHANEQLKLAGKLFDRTGEAILVADENRKIITSNQAFTELTGYSIDKLMGKQARDFAADIYSPAFFEQIDEALNLQDYWQGEVTYLDAQSEELKLWVTINAVKDTNNKHTNFVMTYSDVNEIKNVQRKIEFLATHDELTRLPNRSVLMERLGMMLTTAKRQESMCAVLFFDLDDFKKINDSLGHNVGDLLLKQVSRRLQKCIRDTDILARMGGDEFVAILQSTSVNEIDEVAQRIIKVINAPFEINEHTLFASASIGISVYPDDGADNFVLLKNADTAMYRSKELGRNQYQFFTEEMKQEAVHKMEIEKALRSALTEGHFSMSFQPQVEINSGAIVGLEALLRCDSEALEGTPAQKFIEVAERGRLIEEIGLHALDLVFQQIHDWHTRNIEVPKVAINISVKQLQDDSFVTHTAHLMKKYKIKPKQLKFEITESALAERMDVLIEELNKLVDMGIVLSVDDFGVGQSSLSQLRKLPIHELKIDKSFIAGMCESEDAHTITLAIIRMAHALGLQVVAEGVENAAQLEILKNEQCQIVQGFYLYEPQGSNKTAQMLSSAPQNVLATE